MNVIHNPHDNFFKSVMGNLKVATEFLQHHLPATLQSQLDFETLELESGSYIDEDLQASASDILYKVNYLKKSESVYLYLLIDHQSSVDHMMSFRLWRYVFSIWFELFKKNGNASRNKNYRLPLVIPLVFYNGPQKYNGCRDIRELIAAPATLIETYFLKPFQLIDLHDIEDEELRARRWSGILEFSMKSVYAREILDFIQLILDDLKFTWSEGDTILTPITLKYILSQARTDNPKRLMEILKANLTERGDIMGTLVEYLTEQNKGIWLQEGRQEGRQEGVQIGRQEGVQIGRQEGVQIGRQEGVQKGEGTVLIRLLECKFKTIPDRYRQQIEQASPETLLTWAEKVLTSQSLEKVFDV